MVYENYKKSKKVELLNKYDRWREIAKRLKLSKQAKNRLEWMIYYETRANFKSSLTIRYFGIGKSTFYKWKKLFDETNLKSLESKSTRPNKSRGRQKEWFKDKRVIEIRKNYPYFGKIKIMFIYKNTYKQDITSWYIQRVIEEYGLYYRKRKKHYTQKKNRLVKKRITEFKNKTQATGFLLHLDTVELRIQGVKRYVITAIDHYSRIAYARVYKNHTSASAQDFFEKLYYLLDEKIKNVHTDNGSEFHKNFEQGLKKLNLTHWWSRARTPKDNPENERFNRTFREEFLQWGNFNKNIDQFNKNITNWLIEYNSIRPHQSLNYLTPLQYAEKSNKLSTMWSSSTNT